MARSRRAQSSRRVPGLAGRIGRLRRKCGLTLEGLGLRIGRSKQAVLQWEKGEVVPGALSLVGLAKALEVSVDELLGISSPATPRAAEDRP